MLVLRERERERDSGSGWGLSRRSMDASILLDWRDQREMEVFRPRSVLERDFNERILVISPTLP